MKLLIASILIMTMFMSCDDLFKDPASKFPECVGIKESFDPNNIVSSYNGKIWNQDTTMYTLFAFTDYDDLDLYYFSKSWSLWIKFSVGSSTLYQSFDCFKLHESDSWYAWSGMDLKGRYSTWDVYFETFECSIIGGYCEVIFPAENDTLHFNFEGLR